MAVRSFFCSLCPNFLPVLEGESDVVLCVYSRIVRQAAPEAGLEALHQLGFFQGAEKGFYLCPPGLLAADGFIKGFIPCLGGIKPGGQFIVAFLVFGLIEGDMGVFINTFFNEIGRTGTERQTLSTALQSDDVDERIKPIEFVYSEKMELSLTVSQMAK